ncbi:ribbon-helix-helix protein, CopG family [Elstera sp.]|jgi:predicted transcriptional regulator|uniref:ribbon-helix-helix protein, CopG family n=1 Tax=Elstera sp. TaxID=1916664 RepID=UPI0037BFA8AE
MVKSSALSFRVSSEIKEGLERAAKDDDRSVSSLVERILKSWLADRNYLPPEEGR